ncbi:hypothetical protein UCDDA912_g10602 [Diaporthe ampelina]|uniref:Uncharacterized protein n=1 Tax=Diaporthe ampelina TaxID=1214573 RepID=A0A0G2F5H5_9PEZI|nr:hypothetical protein UCDDA912_g10602 [Diaporthe ampelina]
MHQPRRVGSLIQCTAHPRLYFSLLGEGTWNRTYCIARHCHGATAQWGDPRSDGDAEGGQDKDEGDDEGDSASAAARHSDDDDRKLSRYVLRVSLPVWPGRKVRSEVASMNWVLHNTSIPLPRVLGFADPTATGESLGGGGGGGGGDVPVFPYPWILMDKMPGVPFADVHRTISQDAKAALACKLADWVHELAVRPFPLIGSLDMDVGMASSASLDGGEAGDEAVVNYTELSLALVGPGPGVGIGPVVSQKFFGDWRLEYSLNRGPFPDLHAFATSLVACQLADVDDPRQRLRTAVASAGTDGHGEPPPGARDAAFAFAFASAAGPGADTATGNKSKARRNDYCSEAQHEPGAPVCLCSSRYVSAEQMDGYKSTCETLSRLIDMAVPRSPIWHDSPRDACAPHAADAGAVLYHWDISEDNLLVDPETGEATGVIDWEQLCLVPIPLARYYPALLEPGPDAPEYPSISEWEPGRTKPEWRLVDEDRCSRRLMRDAFDGRMLQLASPWLDAHVQEDFDGRRIGGRRSVDATSTKSGEVGTKAALATDIVRHAMKTWYQSREVEELCRREEALRRGEIKG